jgi:predicted MFS family arabinose efflux permease
MEQGRPQPRVKKTPKVPLWSELLRPWLRRRVQYDVDRFTHRLGGPARRRVILLLALVLALNSADNSAIGAIAPQLETALGIGTAQIGLLVTASSLFGALAALPFGILIDKSRRVPVLAISVVLWGVAEAVSGFSTSFGMLLLTRLALGAVTATAAPAVASLVGDFFPAGERGRIYGYIITGEVVGAGVGIGVAALVSGILGWRAAFVLLAIPSIVLAWALWVRLPEPARGGQSRLEPGATKIVSAKAASRSGGAAGAGASDAAAPRSDDVVLRQVRKHGVAPNEEIVVVADPARMSTLEVIRYVFRVRTNVVIIIVTSLGYLFLAGLRTFAVIFARGHFDVGQATATLLLAVIGAGALIGLLLSGRLADRLVGRGHISARIVVAAIAFIVAAALLVPALVSTRFVVSLPLLILAAAAISAPNPPLNAAQLDVVPAQLWGRATGVRTAVRSALEAVGPLIFGVVAALFVAGGGPVSTTTDRAAMAAQAPGLEVAFLVMLIPLAGAGVLLLVMRRHYAVDVASAGESERRGEDAKRS